MSNYTQLIDEMVDLEAALLERDPVAAAAVPTDDERRAMTEADSVLELARQAVSMAISQEQAASHHASAIEARYPEEATARGIRLGNVTPRRNLTRGPRLEAALDAVDAAKQAVADARDVFERAERDTRQVHARVSASGAARRATAEAAQSKRYTGGAT